MTVSLKQLEQVRDQLRTARMQVDALVEAWTTEPRSATPASDGRALRYRSSCISEAESLRRYLAAATPAGILADRSEFRTARRALVSLQVEADAVDRYGWPVASVFNPLLGGRYLIAVLGALMTVITAALAAVSEQATLWTIAGVSAVITVVGTAAALTGLVRGLRGARFGEIHGADDTTTANQS